MEPPEINEDWETDRQRERVED